jgi:hypothetical protein
MSTIGSKLETSLAQAVAASQQSARSRERENAKTESARKMQDQVDLRTAGVESNQAVRKLPQSDPEQSESRERRSTSLPPKDDGKKKKLRIDLTA